MRNPLSETITAIPPSGIRKFFDIVSEMKDAISLGVGEPDFDTPWHIRDEGIYSLEKGRTSVGSKNRYASWVGKKNPDAVKIKPAARATRIPRPSP